MLARFQHHPQQPVTFEAFNILLQNVVVAINSGTESNMKKLEERLDKRIGSIEGKVNDIETNMKGMSDRIGSIEGKVNEIETNMKVMSKKIESI